MKYIFVLTLSLSFCLTSCNSVKKKTKESINYGGEVVGEAATEFVEGVSEGIDNTLECEIAISDDLISKGVNNGVYSIEDNWESDGFDNMLSVYLTFDKAFKGNLTSVVYNKTNKEKGRATLAIDAKAGSSDYYEFVFHDKTEINVKDIIKISE